MRDHTDTRWHGNTDHKTSPSAFFYDPRSDHYGEAEANFIRVLTELGALCETRDVNGDCVVQFICERRAEHIVFIAYRFTSDWAYRKYRDRLMEAGGRSLGRGTFQPFFGPSNYDHYFA